MFTCYTNRVAMQYQVPSNCDWKSNDMMYHRNFGENIWNQNNFSVMDITNSPELSGVLILIKKKIWEQFGGFKEEKMLSIDNDIHRRVRNVGGKVGLMKGIYVQHWYRNGDKLNVNHLK